MARLPSPPSRRDLLRAGALGAAGLTLPQLLRLQAQLDARWAAVTRAAHDEPIPDAVRGHADFQALVGTGPLAAARARVVYVKLKQRQAFPTTFDEALNLYTEISIGEPDDRLYAPVIRPKEAPEPVIRARGR